MEKLEISPEGTVFCDLEGKQVAAEVCGCGCGSGHLHPPGYVTCYCGDAYAAYLQDVAFAEAERRAVRLARREGKMNKEEVK